MSIPRASRSVLVMFLALGTSTSALAQSSSSDLLNQRVRLQLKGDRPTRLEGTANSMSATSLQLRETGVGAAPIDVEIDSIASCQKRLGYERNTIPGMLIGGVAGLGAGLLLTATNSDADLDELVALVILISAGSGAVVGAVAGSFVKSDRWQDTPVESLRI